MPFQEPLLKELAAGLRPRHRCHDLLGEGLRRAIRGPPRAAAAASAATEARALQLAARRPLRRRRRRRRRGHALQLRRGLPALQRRPRQEGVHMSERNWMVACSRRPSSRQGTSIAPKRGQATRRIMRPQASAATRRGLGNIESVPQGCRTGQALATAAAAAAAAVAAAATATAVAAATAAAAAAARWRGAEGGRRPRRHRGQRRGMSA
mmetsp:Transcript_44589/g.119314  ORF Transcript_44589/g.119314 Transcript_44589/m.119314 type:complete len:209 (+) Transcript_44589:821-1447(+)